MSLSEQLWGYGGGDPYENNGSFPGLQFNPAPGVPQAVNDLVEDLNRAWKNITSASETLNNVGGHEWSGTAAEAFRAKTQALPKLLDEAGKSFKLAHDVLEKWQSQLGSMQSKTQSYEADAKTARKRAERAEQNEDLKVFRFGGIGMTDAEAEDAKRRYNAAINELGAAQDELEGILSSANNIRNQHEELAGKIASLLKAAAEQAPEGPGLFDELKHGLDQLVKGQELFFHTVTQWVKDHANAIAAIGDTFATISTVTGLVGVVLDEAFPPAGIAMGGISAVTSGLALGLHLVAKEGGAEVSDRTLTEDGLGLVSFGVGKVAKQIGEAESIGKMVNKLGTMIGVGGGAMAIEDWHNDQSPLKQFLPQNKAEGAAMGGTLLLGGPLGPVTALGIAFSHAWESGSEKDRAAHQANG
ncbi:putative T7SS-secreted protein [Streptomyces pinistramenti]|uniref:putative T7SS-secreted protein n=1 Tax=Streptomyces pinistramenti TaxID=2884812 RepID=UPI001D079DC0|nr:hypothetical protein [Streptomyces pinistramenti]MCB5909746.1 hypothetical protein [Streptomyces pinistramenti]